MPPAHAPFSLSEATRVAAQAVVGALGPLASAPVLAIVAGSGLGDLARVGDEVAMIDFDAIPGLGAGQVPGHAGRWSLIQADGGPIHFLAGRRHLYEGIEPWRAGLALRVAARLGTRGVILTNAAGGLVPGLAPGDLMLLDDHLDLMARNPLRGPHEAAMGSRFPDMSAPYDPRLRERLLAAARRRGIDLKQGVYAALTGPCYETQAEAEMLRRLGADAVGMSTVPEALAARQASLAVAAISIVTNSRARPGVTSHEEVLACCRLAAGRLRSLIEAFLES